MEMTTAGFVLRALGGQKLKDKYNEAVADGHLPCAPQTVKGGERKFDESDITTTGIFARCLDLGFSARVAGEITCSADAAVRKLGRPALEVRLFRKAGKWVARAYGDYNHRLEDWDHKISIEINLLALMRDNQKILAKALKEI